MDPNSPADISELEALRLENAQLKKDLSNTSPWPAPEFLSLFPNGLAFLNLDREAVVYNSAFLKITGLQDPQPGSLLNIGEHLDSVGINNCLVCLQQRRHAHA